MEILNKKFVNDKGIELSLKEILKQKILSIKVSYLSNKEVKRYFFNLIEKKQKQIQKSIQISDNLNLFLEIHGKGDARIRFSNKEEFEKLEEGTFDEETIYKKFIFTIFPQYVIFFNIQNLEEINWS